MFERDHMTDSLEVPTSNSSAHRKAVCWPCTLKLTRMASKSKARCVYVHIHPPIHSDSLINNNYWADLTSTLIVRLISTAQTGFFYTTQRVRTGPRLAAVKYDPRGAYVRILVS